MLVGLQKTLKIAPLSIMDSRLFLPYHITVLKEAETACALINNRIVIGS